MTPPKCHWVRGAFGVEAPARPVLLSFLFPPGPDAGKNLSGFLDVAVGPQPNFHASYSDQRGRIDRAGRNVPLKRKKRAA